MVTGGAKGIGWATVEALLAEGARPVLFDRDAARSPREPASWPAGASTTSSRRLDVSDEAAVEAAMARVRGALRRGSTCW